MSQEAAAPQESFSFVNTEHGILKFWKDNQIFEKSLAATKEKPPYIFYDGPPFATGLPHHGHLVGSILKDIVPRYFTMKGRYVERRFGWDCHGLPIEHEIDKKLGLSAQEAVAQLGIAGYNAECRGIVQRYTSEWEKTITRIGRWVDFENDYKTMDPSFMESCWWVFQQLWEKNLVYQGVKVVPFSTALGTVLSNFEAGSNYKDVQDPAITILFKAEGEDNTYFAAWTTTPWTLPSNLCLCVNAELDYVKIRDEDSGKLLIMGAPLVEGYRKKHKLSEPLATFKGSELKGRRYAPLFPYFAELANDGAFQILNDAYVTADGGTGIVHIAPAFGEDDNRVMREAGLKMAVCPVDDAGKFTKEVGDYKGIYVKDADKDIIHRLKEEGKLFERAQFTHSYPFCPRSDTPLIYKAIPSWYVKVEELRERMLAANAQIHWVPEHIKDGRFGNWLANARDWAISRNRVWGTPLPIWINDETNSRHCIGSIAELEKLTGTKIADLHRENVDGLTFTKAGEPGTYRRIPEVFDCWFESGSMPYAQLHYPFENQQMFKDGFPAEFIAEGLDQTRGWFYTLTVLSTALYDKPAFRNVIVNGLVLAQDGEKMSKRKKNYTAPDELMERFGADALRLYLITSGLVKGDELKFKDDEVRDMVRRALLPWFNSFKFYSTYAEVDGFDLAKHRTESTNILDKWLLSNLQTLKKNIAAEMEAYHLYNVVPALLTFIEDLTNTYIRLNRPRFWSEGTLEENADKRAAFTTLHTALRELALAMAPFSPFFAEHSFQELKKLDKGEKALSVHLCSYPEADESKIDALLEKAVSRMTQILELGRNKRTQVKIKVKTPLKSLTVIHKDALLLKEIALLESYIQAELNVKEVRYAQNEEAFIKLIAQPNLPVLGKELGKEMGRFTGLIKALPSTELAKLEESGTLTIGGRDFNKNEIKVLREALPGTNAVSNSLISIDLDCTLDEALAREGLAREIVKRIQETRKKSGFKVADRIKITLTGSSDVLEAAAEHKAYICDETLGLELTIAEPANATVFDIEGSELKLGISKA
ncbi:MAG: hypothetical protein RL095_3926 [Verrucomicrobiota bacterium]|jgi:isoleucyl-tRNA synthetase